MGLDVKKIITEALEGSEEDQTSEEYFGESSDGSSNDHSSSNSSSSSNKQSKSFQSNPKENNMNFEEQISESEKIAVSAGVGALNLRNRIANLQGKSTSWDDFDSSVTENSDDDGENIFEGFEEFDDMLGKAIEKAQEVVKNSEESMKSWLKDEGDKHVEAVAKSKDKMMNKGNAAALAGIAAAAAGVGGSALSYGKGKKFGRSRSKIRESIQENEQAQDLLDKVDIEKIGKGAHEKMQDIIEKAQEAGKDIVEYAKEQYAKFIKMTTKKGTENVFMKKEYANTFIALAALATGAMASTTGGVIGFFRGKKKK